MLSILIIADKTDHTRKLSSDLAQSGFACSITPNVENAIGQATERTTDLVLVAIDVSPDSSGVRHLTQMVKQERHLPVIALLSREALGSLDTGLDVDDFIIEPWEPAEVAARAKRVLQRTNNIDSEELMRCGDLVIDLARCEISIGGRSVMLTFREYELLKFLVRNKGRVFTREALLNKVWGWDYYGGDRTVDVHIRRLRSKIEGSTNAFIETVRNIGYRFSEKA